MNAGLCFEGFKPAGQGFIFDDADEEATSLSEMRRIVEADPSARNLIFPYIGGEEVNTSPTHSPHRFIINFGTMKEEEASRWPDLMAIVSTKVRPVRSRSNRDAHRKRWWQYGEVRPGLVAAVAGIARVLVISRVGQHGAFTFLPSGMIYSEQLVVFPLIAYAAFCTLQSRVHEVWARFFGSSLEDRLRYTPSDCFETFPLPPGFDTAPALEAAGRTYYEFRAELMLGNNEGLTKTYNRFHDPDERGEDVLRLRELHAEMDRAVLDAYGWTNLDPRCEFLLDYEEEDEESNKRRKPWRYRWPDEFRDDVLARLLNLNQQRAEEERLVGAAANTRSSPAAKRTRRSKPADHHSGALFSR